MVNQNGGSASLLNFNCITHHPQFNLLKLGSPALFVLLHPASITDHIGCVNDKLHQVVADQHASVTPLAFDLLGSRMSPRSGRLIVAQQFTAGIRSASEELVREADG
jgi:hypothetical protein